VIEEWYEARLVEVSAEVILIDTNRRKTNEADALPLVLRSLIDLSATCAKRRKAAA
jgi:hypothetical protein